MVARSKSSNQRPDTLMQDRKPTARRKPLATRGRTIHSGHSRRDGDVRCWRKADVRRSLKLDQVDAGQRDLVNDRTRQNVSRSLILIGVITRHSVYRNDYVKTTQGVEVGREDNAVMRRDTNRFDVPNPLITHD